MRFQTQRPLLGHSVDLVGLKNRKNQCHEFLCQNSRAEPNLPLRFVYNLHFHEIFSLEKNGDHGSRESSDDVSELITKTHRCEIQRVELIVRRR